MLPEAGVGQPTLRFQYGIGLDQSICFAALAGIAESCDLPRVTANPSVDSVLPVVVNQFIVLVTELVIDCDRYLADNIFIPGMVPFEMV